MYLRLKGVSNGSIEIEVEDAAGELIASNAAAEMPDANSLSLELPEDGDYRIHLKAAPDAPRMDFDLEIRVGGANDAADATGESGLAEAVAADAGPVPVRFAPGARESIHMGQIDSGGMATFSLSSAAGLRLGLALDGADAGRLDLMVFDPIQRPMRPESVQAGMPEVYLLREAGEYTITISNTAASGRADYLLRFTLE
jgi:hypothetical protein